MAGAAHQEAKALRDEIERMSRIYSQEVLPQRTRVVSLFGRKCQPQILDTFLGFELKFARKRITCPDRATARYLKIFAEVGMATIRTPYDPTVTLRVLPQLERILERIKDLARAQDPGQNTPPTDLTSLYRKIRGKLKRAEDQLARQPR